MEASIFLVYVHSDFLILRRPHERSYFGFRYLLQHFLHLARVPNNLRSSNMAYASQSQNIPKTSHKQFLEFCRRKRANLHKQHGRSSSDQTAQSFKPQNQRSRVASPKYDRKTVGTAEWRRKTDCYRSISTYLVHRVQGQHS